MADYVITRIHHYDKETLDFWVEGPDTETVAALVLSARPGQTVEFRNHYPHPDFGTTTTTLIVADKDGGTEATLTDDGIWTDEGHWETDDRRLSDDLDGVYYERWDRRGRVAHGWVDRHTRRLVQSG